MSLDHARTMAAYNRWMNERLYTVCARMDDTERKHDMGAFFGSVHGTLNHLLLGDRLWMGRFLNRSFEIESLDQELYADFGDLRRERDATDVEIIAWAGSLSEADLAAPLTWTSVSSSGRRTYPLWALVVHFFNHQTHHRGQLTTLISQSGRDPGLTDLVWMPGLVQPVEGPV